MNEYDLLGGLHNIIDENIDRSINKWLDKHNVNFYLLYPLAMVEIGAMEATPECMENLFKRNVASFVYSKAISSGREIFFEKFNIPGFKKYMKDYEEILLPLYQNYRFSREINDVNPVSKPRLVQVEDHRYQLTTSLVTNKYKEENFYFYGVDDEDRSETERKQYEELHALFWSKIVTTKGITIKSLEKKIDQELYEKCVEIVKKDVKKWEGQVRSNVFGNPRQIILVIAFFYYHAMIRTICTRIVTQEGESFADNADECIMVFNKKVCIRDISLISSLREKDVEKIINYFINKGSLNLLEFPLFEVEGNLITIPSLFLVNDWQFTIVNGHYVKNIEFTNREKTISTITEKRIENILCNVSNVAIAKTIPYSFINESGVLQNGEIDFAILDQKRNILLIIEAKWINKHYKDEIDKRYGKILETLNGIFNRQMKGHKQYLTTNKSIDSLFVDSKNYIRNDVLPEIIYLAVDKRNQMHIEEKHMISEYMLLYFIKKHIQENEFNISDFWDEISELQTKVEYITCSSEFYEIAVGEDVVLIEKDDLYWNEYNNI